MKLLQELSVDPMAHPLYSLQNGVIQYNDRVWVWDNKELQLHIIQALHSSALGGHSGFLVTYIKIRRLFAWKGMKKDIKAFVSSCAIYVQAKPDRVQYPGLLSPLPVPSES
jgi:hypothetical protein